MRTDETNSKMMFSRMEVILAGRGQRTDLLLFGVFLSKGIG